MAELHKYYAQRLFGLVALLLVAAVLLNQLHTNLVDNHAAGWALTASDLLNQHVVLIAVLFAGELLIRKWLWRVERPHLYFGGRWRGTTTYTRRWLADDAQMPLPDPAKHEVHIQQDCLGVAITPSTAAAFSQWHSVLCDLVPQGIAYAYEVTYSSLPGSPFRAQGYEKLNVVKAGCRGRPAVISGEFHHLVSDDKPVFSGIAQFDRIQERSGWRCFKAKFSHWSAQK